MTDADRLADLLRSLDGRGYKAYKAVQGEWRFPGFMLHVDHVQGDPFADPSRVRVLLGPDEAGLPASAFASRPRALGVAAFLARSFADRAGTTRGEGTGRSGEIRMTSPGQETLPQTAVQVGPDGSLDARFTVGLPARGRRILGRAAARLLTERVPELVTDTLLFSAHDPEAVELHAVVNEDAEHLRNALPELGLVGFVADDAVLPRRSGVDDRPLQEGAVAFRSPDSLRVSVELPNAGRITGLGLPPGVTLIAGGGFHGKSTLLRALEAGVYNHRPGDGRERVVALPQAVKVRAEDGRAVAGVDISPFIDGLPMGRGTRAFTTANASGSTSQAAAIVEALEAGARLLLVDEDTSATNFMIRDRRMQALVPAAAEPITPFVDRVRALHEDLAVSSVLVVGGSGDYLDVADTVLLMRDYRPADATDAAGQVAREHPTGRIPERPASLTPPRPRVPKAGSVDPRRGRRSVHVRVPDARTMLLGRSVVDLAAVEQLVSLAQIRAVGRAMAWLAKELVDGRRGLPELLDHVDALLARDGLDGLVPEPVGDLAAFRRYELAAALNRLQSFMIAPNEPPDSIPAREGAES